MKNPYQVLEVEKDADEKEIKKAYRRLAFEWHPDKNSHRIQEAEEKFKEISEAYQILTDKEKRERYDRFGTLDENEMGGGGNPFQGGGGGRGPFMNPNDIFKMFFNGGMDFPFPHQQHMFQTHHQHPQQPQHPNMRRQTPFQKVGPKIDLLEFNLHTLYHGGKKKVTTKVNEICKTCKGIGGSNLTSCKNCDGNGQIIQTRVIGPGMVQRIQSVCTICKGVGKKIENVCMKCNGEKVTPEDKVFIIDIERGLKDGDKIIFEGMGNEMDGHDRGDMIFIIREKKHERFERKLNDLYYTQDVLLGDSLVGYTIDFEHLNGETIRYYENGVIQPNSVRKIRMKGMPIRNTPNFYGDLYIVYRIKYPLHVHMTEEQKEKVRSIFPCLQSRQEVEVIQHGNHILQNSELLNTENSLFR